MKRRLGLGISAFLCIMLLHFAPPAIATDLCDNGFRVIAAGIPCNLVQTYEIPYTKTFRDCRFVVFGDTTEKGFHRFVEGNADLMVAARKMTKDEAMKAGENGITPEPKLLGLVSLAVIVDAKNPVRELTMEQVKKIFSGKIVNWSQVGGPDQPIRVVRSAVPETGAGLAFQKRALDGAAYAKDSTIATDCYGALEKCSKPGAIGYFPTASPLFEELGKRGMKAVALRLTPDSEAIIPGPAVAKEPAYPITMPLYFYYDAKAVNTCISKFAYFCAYLKQTACLEKESDDN